MSQLVRKSAPLLVTLAFVAWCCWSQVSESKPLLDDMDEAKLPRIDRHALRPEISALSQRDPFVVGLDKPAEAARVEAVSQAPTELLFDPRTVLSSLRLNATIVGTDRPSAILNGRIYGQGEQIALAGLSDLDCRLQRVEAERVILKIEKEEFEIIYSPLPTTRQKQAKEPQPASTTPGQPDLAASRTGKEDPYAKLLKLLSAALPDLGANLESLRDQCLSPLPTSNETQQPDGRSR